MSRVELASVSIELDGRRVVDGVSAAIAPGEWVTLIGPNGAGKTSLLRAVGGLVAFTGRVAIDGDEVSRLGHRELARRVAFVPQSPLLPPDMRVCDYVLLGRTPHIGTFGAESERDLDVVDQALDRLDLVGLADRQLRTLSGGERQRAVLARALAQDAPLLLLDEPTSALDLGRQQQALELVASLRGGTGLTVISAMHELTLAAQYADRLILLSDGGLVAAGPAHEIVTEGLISAHYGASVRVVRDGGAPVAVVPERRRA